MGGPSAPSPAQPGGKVNPDEAPPRLWRHGRASLPGGPGSGFERQMRLSALPRTGCRKRAAALLSRSLPGRHEARERAMRPGRKAGCANTNPDASCSSADMPARLGRRASDMLSATADLCQWPLRGTHNASCASACSTSPHIQMSGGVARYLSCLLRAGASLRQRTLRGAGARAVRERHDRESTQLPLPFRHRARERKLHPHAMSGRDKRRLPGLLPRAGALCERRLRTCCRSTAARRMSPRHGRHAAELLLPARHAG